MKKKELKNFKVGDKVVMHTCAEAANYKGKIWTVKHDSYVAASGQEVVFLEGFRSYFACCFLNHSNDDLQAMLEAQKDGRQVQCRIAPEGGWYNVWDAPTLLALQDGYYEFRLCDLTPDVSDKIARIDPEPHSNDTRRDLEWLAKSPRNGLEDYSLTAIVRLLIAKVNELTDSVNQLKANSHE